MARGRVAIVDYGSGNLRSAQKAFERAARDEGLPLAIDVTSDPQAVAEAERIVLPGVGAFGDCRRGLYAVPGMVEALEEAVIRGGRPFLGICVGMQLMVQEGLEFGRHEGLGWLEGQVVAMEPGNGLKVPHMGWNELGLTQAHALTAGIAAGDHAYFVHSYRVRGTRPDHVLATSDYGEVFPAVIGRDNMAGTQFHPEKSQATGLRLIGNFLRWRP
ncbi:imidazole glycerol phosphate synthase subunit HisH [Zavarzinia sp. CC-PAN008]|uniref:imidazole glycerol phosphate synthase subunit HisH n=1 Tax=Zavarzinia sp. CC-PAN008 TaxID=3243332 RepID=UPI003F745DD5